MKNNTAKPGVNQLVNSIHEDYVAIAKKYPYAKGGIKRVEAVLDRANEYTVAFLGLNAESTHRVVCALLSCKEHPRSLTKKTLRYVALPNSAELPAEPISCEHLANLKANYVELTFTPTGADAPVSGPIVEETEETVTLKVGDSNQVFAKKEVITQGKIVDFEENEIVCSVAPESLDTDGALSLDADEIVLNVNGSEVVMDPLDIRSWQCTAVGKRRVSYKVVFTPDENGVVPPAENIPLARVGNAATRADVASVDIGLDNALLRDGRAILVMPSFDVFNADMWESVRHAEALFVVLDNRVRAEEETFLAQIRHFTQNIFFVQDNIEDAEWKEVRRKNVRALAACLGESPGDINACYFPVSSARKVSADSREDWQEGLRSSRFPRLLQWFESLDPVAAKKHRNHRALERIRYEAETLKLTLLLHHKESQWTADLLGHLRKNLEEKYPEIHRQTEDAFRRTFGSAWIQPIVMEEMGRVRSRFNSFYQGSWCFGRPLRGLPSLKFLYELSPLKPFLEPDSKELRDEGGTILENFLQQIVKETAPIFDDYFKKITVLPEQLVKAVSPAPSTDTDTAVHCLLINGMDKHILYDVSTALHLRYNTAFSSRPDLWGEHAQSAIFPMLIFASPAVTWPILGITGIAFCISRVLRHSSVERLQKEKNLDELGKFMTNICKHLHEEFLRELQTMGKHYKKAFNAAIDRFALDAKRPNADIQNIDRDIQNIDKLLDIISQQLPGFK